MHAFDTTHPGDTLSFAVDVRAAVATGKLAAPLAALRLLNAKVPRRVEGASFGAAGLASKPE